MLSLKVVPLPNLQVASMRRELEAEQPGMRYPKETTHTNKRRLFWVLFCRDRIVSMVTTICIDLSLKGLEQERRQGRVEE